MLTISRSPSRTRHPFENLFVDLGSHSPDKALEALELSSILVYGGVEAGD
jgi:hypothetical protein